MTILYSSKEFTERRYTNKYLNLATAKRAKLGGKGVTTPATVKRTKLFGSTFLKSGIYSIFMSDKKIIKINANFFSNKNKTQKVKKEKITMPLINPSILKKNLINRIKAYKNKEGLKVKEDIITNTRTNKKDDDIGAFTDEFNDSINYLDILSKRKKEEKIQLSKPLLQPYNIQQQQQQQRQIKQNIERNTLKNYNQSQTPFVQLELPEELREPFIFNNIESPVFKLNIEKNEDVPFGCLKNGLKPTYRTWQMTKRNKDNLQQQIQSQTQLQPQTQLQTSLQFNNEPKEVIRLSEREKRLEIIKQKLKTQQLILDKEKELERERERENDMESILFNKLNQFGPPGIPEGFNEIQQNPLNDVPDTNELAGIVEDIKNEPKVMIKKTIKRRYTLGKSNIYKKVGILIKNENTRKKIINAHKELKKKPINDIKQYLKDHGLIKVGSNAPNDVLRKIYESSMLAGDVINNNKEVLLHNFLKDTSC